MTDPLRERPAAPEPSAIDPLVSGLQALPAGRLVLAVDLDRTLTGEDRRGWGRPPAWERASEARAALAVGRRLRKAGHPIDLRTASFGAPAHLMPVIMAEDARLSVATNADRVDVLPPGHDKGTGLLAALRGLGGQVPIVAVGDGDNDLPLLACADLAVAVANATPTLRRHADAVTATPGPHGVRDVVHAMLAIPRPPPSNPFP